MRTAFTLSALVSSVFAATAPFQLVISGSRPHTHDLKDRALVVQGDALLVAPKGEHGINFTGGDGTLGLVNGDVVYVGADGHVDLKSTDGIAAGGLTEGFTTGRNNALEWAQGQFFACPHKSLFAAGPPTYMVYASRSGVTLPSDCIQINVKKTAI